LTTILANTCASVSKQYNLLPAKGQCCSVAEKVWRKRSGGK